MLGLTVLAWGNSVGDLSTNMAMARKGLSNMAMTACFAGPVFNMLVGLGLGFSLLGPTEVRLSGALAAGLAFLAVNSVAIGAFGVLNKQFVPKKYGVVMLATYALYMLVSFLFLFGAFD